MTKTISKIILFIFMLISFLLYNIPGISTFLLSWGVWFFILACVNLVIWQKLRIAVFSLLIIWIYALVGNVIPQQEFRQASLGEIERTPAAFVKAGEQIFKGKGMCSTCHSIGPGAANRGPNLESVGVKATQRKPPMTAKEYFIESMYEPAAHVVEGYSNIMPPPWRPPVALKPIEIETIIAFLQSQGGEVDVTPFDPPVDIAAAVAATPERVLTGNATTGQFIFDEKVKCLSCHKVGETGGAGETEDEELAAGEVGPELTEIGALNTVNYIEESILFPNVQIIKGYAWATIWLNDGEKLEGTLKEEDAEKIVLDIEGELKTILKSELAEKRTRPSNLERKGYLRKEFPISVTVELDEGENLEGILIGEDEENITLKVQPEPKTIKKEGIDEIRGKRIRTQIKKDSTWVAVKLSDGGKVKGRLISEDAENLELQVKGSVAPLWRQLTISKNNLKEESTGKINNLAKNGYLRKEYPINVTVQLKDGGKVEGALIGEDEENIELEVQPEPKTIKKEEIDRIVGKRIKTVSKMPTNYDSLLTVKEFNDLLTYTASLKGGESSP